ncbi:MAG: hypothetical protein WCV59_04805 [Parcubacteria group bacterium]|jgi:hypothetical protein
MKKFCIATLVGFFVITAIFVPAPAKANGPDYPAGWIKPLASPVVFVARSVAGLFSRPGAAFCNANGSFLYKVRKGTDAFMSYPEFVVVDQFATGLVPTFFTPWNTRDYSPDFCEHGMIATYAEKVPVWNYGKWGAATGGLLAAAYGPFAGTTMIETYAASTAAGAVGGAIVGLAVDSINR